MEQELRRAIRDEHAKDPLITISRLQERLKDRFSRDFHRDYLGRLPHKVARETVMEIDRAQTKQRMAFTREDYRMVREGLMEIMYWDKAGHPGDRPPQKRDIVEAAKSVAMLDLALLKAEIECGLYKKPVEELAKEVRYEPLPGEMRAIVIAAWQRGELLPPATIEEMVPNIAQGSYAGSLKEFWLFA